MNRNHHRCHLPFVIVTGLSLVTSSLFAQSSHPTSIVGLPFSGTSLTADHQLRQSGFLDSMSREEFEMSEGAEGVAADAQSTRTSRSSLSDADGGFSGAADDRGGFDITPTYGAFSSPQLDGDTYALPAYAAFKLTDRVGLNFNVPMQYTRFRGPGGELEVWNINATVGVPIKVIPKMKGSPFSWTLTPHVGAGGYYADDGADSTTYVGHGGLTSMLGFQNQHVTLSLANQITFYETIDRSGMYDFTPEISQKIWKNGLKISMPFAHRWIGDVYGIHTEFLENAFLDRYFTLGASVGYHLASMKKGSYLKLGTYTELAHGYQAIHFQFGTGWKF